MKWNLPVILGLLFFIMFSTFLFAGEGWLQDSILADKYLQKKDYNAAWLFYQRAMQRGLDDGRVLFRAARSFQHQELIENDDFQKRLFTVARYLLQSQYPNESAIMQAERYYDSRALVNSRYIRKTYAFAGAGIPDSERFLVKLLPRSKSFFSSTVQDLQNLFAVIRLNGFQAAWMWARQQHWSFLVSIFLAYSITGLILPIVLALTVSRDGRKSYVAAYALFLHWGFLGVHRFYLGRYTSGVIWLLTGGLLGLGLFFDFFLIGEYVHFWNEENKDTLSDRSMKAGLSLNKPQKRKSYSGQSRNSKRVKATKRKKTNQSKEKINKTRPEKQKSKPEPPPKEEVDDLDSFLPLNEGMGGTELENTESFNFDELGDESEIKSPD